MAIVVVGAAIIRDGRLLAAQRSEPPRLRGGWELPGGKVDPGESDEAALIRECREELGVGVRLRARVGGDWPLIRPDEGDPPTRAAAPIAPGSPADPTPPPSRRRAVLRVWTAELLSGEPRPLEHLALRWLHPSELGAVPWLPSDVPVLEELRPLLTATRA